MKTSCKSVPQLYTRSNHIDPNMTPWEDLVEDPWSWRFFHGLRSPDDAVEVLYTHTRRWSAWGLYCTLQPGDSFMDCGPWWCCCTVYNPMYTHLATLYYLYLNCKKKNYCTLNGCWFVLQTVVGHRQDSPKLHTAWSTLIQNCTQ